MKILWILLCSLTSFSQITIEYPVDRIVIQRDNTNKADLQIAGNFEQNTDSIQARLLPVQSGQGRETGWRTITRNPAGGVFLGIMTVTGGWYRLEINAYSRGEVVASDHIEHVGIGEVFIVSGQSNAEGNLDFEGSSKGTTEDRVSSINFKDSFFRLENIPFRFSQLSDGNRIGPYNPVPWLWAGFAEKLVKEYNVPVLLYGAAVGGTSSKMWYDSMLGNNLAVDFGSIVKFEGSPYAVIRKTLQNFVSKTGARALLWQQGESDAFTDVFTYYERIKLITESTQRDIHAPLSWVVAQSSRTPNPTPISYAQFLLYNNLDYVFQGPDTDQIFGPDNRSDDIHFHRDGIALAGKMWFDSFKNNRLLSEITPVKAREIVLPQVNCSGSNSNMIQVSTPCCYETYLWTNGQTSSEVSFSSGKARVTVSKNGITYFSPTIPVIPSEFKKPEIIRSGPTEFCEGSRPLVLSSESNNVVWSNFQKETSIQPTQSGSYYALKKNLYGCILSSDTVNVIVNQKPQFTINFNTKIPAFCEGESLTATIEPPFPDYKWSNSAITQSVLLNTPGTYSVHVIDEKSCISDRKSIEIAELPKPVGPVINMEKPFTLSLIPSDQLEYVWFKEGVPVFHGSYELRVSEPGEYTSKAYQSYMIGQKTLSCPSDFSLPFRIDENTIGQPIRFYPNPVRREVTVDSFEKPQSMNLRIYTMRGQQVLNETVIPQGFKTTFMLPELPEGTYIFKAGSRSHFFESKMIITR